MLAHIGTSGWNYKHWRDLFYPQGLRTAEWLNFFSRHFDTVELNSSFYRIPTAESVARWPPQTPEGFEFAVKLWRGITHYRKLVNCSQFLENFFTAVSDIPPAKRAPLLIQLPPTQALDLEKLETFWADLTAANRRRWRVALEFRHSSWLTPEVYRFCDRHRAAVCLHDMQGKGDTAEPNDVDFVYLRRHGSGGGRYSGSYSPHQIAADAERVRNWLRQGKEVYAYYNNDIGGHAIMNAQQLKRAVVTSEAA